MMKRQELKAAIRIETIKKKREDRKATKKKQKAMRKA